MSNERRACPHCGREVPISQTGRHARVCLDNPDLATRLREFLHERAENGCIMPRDEYVRVSAALDLPSSVTLKRSIGTWSQVAAWAGLKPAPGRLTPEIDALVDELGPDPEREAEFQMFVGLRARPGILVRPAWDIRQKRYVPAVMETGWCMLI